VSQVRYKYDKKPGFLRLLFVAFAKKQQP